MHRPTDELSSATQPDLSEACVLTGATGFVGGELLLRLMQRGRRPIVCLTRAENDRAAAGRGLETLQNLLGREPSLDERARITWLRADLEASDLGLSAEARAGLVSRMVEIFHCAASVDFDLPLEVAHRINVDAVERLVDLAAEVGPRFERFHHVSTAFVAGRTNKRTTGSYLPSDHRRNFRNTYERTKARAERYLRGQTQVPVTVYRPSIIAGDTYSGRTTNWNVVYVPMRQISRGRLPFLRCGGRAIVDTVGVDYVVDGIVELSKHEAVHGTTYNLTASEQAFDVRDYVAACTEGMKRYGVEASTKTVSPASWWMRTRIASLLSYAPSSLRSLRRFGAGVKRGLRSFLPYEPYTSVNVVFDSSVEQEILSAKGISMPPPSVYLPIIIDYALENGFGREGTELERCEVETLRRTRRVSSWRSAQSARLAS